MRERLRTGRKVGRTIYVQHGPEPSDSDQLVGMVDSGELADALVRAWNDAPNAPPEYVDYPEAKFALLVQLDGRRGGEVTLRPSRVPIAMILATIRHHGVEEALLSWPQFERQEMDVLARLQADLTEVTPIEYRDPGEGPGSCRACGHELREPTS